MHVSNSAAAMPLSQMAHSQQSHEAKEGPGPDHDGDGDDAAGVSAMPAKAPTPQGVGTMVDVSA